MINQDIFMNNIMIKTNDDYNANRNSDGYKIFIID